MVSSLQDPIWTSQAVVHAREAKKKKEEEKKRLLICSETAKKSKQVFITMAGTFKEFVGWDRDKRQGKAKQVMKTKEMQ